MQYKTLHSVSEVVFVHDLNKEVGAGSRLVSAGANINQTHHCLEWWAILEGSEVDKSMTEEVKEAGKRAELLEAARMIAEHCISQGNHCKGCSLYMKGARCAAMPDITCSESKATPDNWRILERRIDDV